MPFINSDDPKRELFRFEHAGRRVHLDPSVVWRRLNAASVELGETWHALAKRWSESAPAANDTIEEQGAKLDAFAKLRETITEVGRRVFDLAPLDDDGNGVTEEFVMAVLCDFVGDRDAKAPIAEPSPSAA